MFTTGLQAGEPSVASGQRLFKASRCLDCHGVDVFTREDRKVKDLNGLENKVRQCDAGLSTNWFDDQILDVVAYLNATYYRFGANEAAVESEVKEITKTDEAKVE
ncbi:MAG: hypothetical protein CSA79_01910 [Thiothrix nivea]|nr:MAG: hypothetical protein CSA79_01910 [Thiothrix nivea]